MAQVLAVIFLSIWFFSPTRQVADPTLDISNYASFAYFTAHGFQFGTEVLHVGGPYGFVQYGFVHGGNLFWKRLPLELLTKLVLAGLIVWYFRRAAGGGWRWVWLVAMLTMVPLVDDLAYDAAILFSGLCVLSTYPTPGWRSGVVCCGVAAFMALLTLIKGTHAMLALITFGLLVGLAFLVRTYRRLAWVLASYLATLVILMLAAGQNPLRFPMFLRSIIEQSAGYNSAMAVEESRAVFITGVTAFVVLETLVVLLLLSRWRNPVALIGSTLLAGFTFVEWKHGFVRADGHVFIFFHYACLAAPAILLFMPPTGSPGRPSVLRWGTAALAALAIGLGLWATGEQVLQRHRGALVGLGRHFREATRQIVQPVAEKTRLDAMLASQRRLFELPLFREIVGQASIDFYGTDHGYLTLNRLNYRPRPMGGGNFSVFNEWLHDLNVDYLTSAGSPAYFAARPGTIDERFLAQDDAGTLRALLALYEPVATEQGMILFRKIPGATLPTPRLLSEASLAPGQEVVLPALPPGQVLAVEFDLPLSLIGRLRALLYKAPSVYMDLEGDGLVRPRGRRVIPACFSRPVPFNPLIEDESDLLDLWSAAPGKRARTFRLQLDQPALWQTAAWKVRFHALPRPAAPAVADLRARLRFPVATRLPVAMTKPDEPLRVFDGLRVQMLPAPASVSFRVSPGDTGVRFIYGIDVAAYTGGGNTDGVEFLVELQRPGQPAQQLSRKMLRPATVPADRPFRVEEILLPPISTDATLVLRTAAGPDNNEAWDWGFVSGITFRSGGYRLDQFPGFNRAPDSLDATICGAHHADGRTVFMLNAPGAVTFQLAGTEKKLSFAAGLLPGAYTNGGQSDGVEFVVELGTADGTVTRLARHSLNPGGDESQRGDQSYTVPLPPTTGGARLTLRVTTGPHGNGAWDWSYLSILDIR